VDPSGELISIPQHRREDSRKDSRGNCTSQDTKPAVGKVTSGGARKEYRDVVREDFRNEFRPAVLVMK
jgi:hypothetical protein